jgi:hypothetical protein
MLDLRPNCERCDCDLPNDGDMSAYICTFECTFCANCAADALNYTCPNCGGDLTLRPTRPAALMDKYPQSTRRVVAAGSGSS